MLTISYIIVYNQVQYNRIQSMEDVEYLKQFAEKLKAIREQQGLSQEKLAAEAGLHRTYIGMVERLERNPSLVCVHKIANGLGVDIRELF